MVTRGYLHYCVSHGSQRHLNKKNISRALILDVNNVINICEIGTRFCLHRGKVMSWHFKNALKGIKGYFYSENFIQKLVLRNTTSKIPGIKP